MHRAGQIQHSLIFINLKFLKQQKNPFTKNGSRMWLVDGPPGDPPRQVRTTMSATGMQHNWILCGHGSPEVHHNTLKHRYICKLSNSHTFFFSVLSRKVGLYVPTTCVSHRDPAICREYTFLMQSTFDQHLHDHNFNKFLQFGKLLSEQLLF